MRSIYTRCRVQERQANFHLRDLEHAASEVDDEGGAAFTVQQEGTLLMGYVPLDHPAAVRTIKTSVIFPLHHSQPDEIWHGEELVTGFSASYPETRWCFIRDGQIYLAFLPLLAEQRDQTFAVQQYGRWGNYGMLTAYNMSAMRPHQLNEQDLRAFGSGFVVELASARQGLSFQEFREEIGKAHATQAQRHGQRELYYKRGAIELELFFDYKALILRRAAAAGRLADSECNGIPQGNIS
jgi:hypothetical protein